MFIMLPYTMPRVSVITCFIVYDALCASHLISLLWAFETFATSCGQARQQVLVTSDPNQER